VPIHLPSLLLFLKQKKYLNLCSFLFYGKKVENEEKRQDKKKLSYITQEEILEACKKYANSEWDQWLNFNDWANYIGKNYK
jgi:CRISPR/Cas system CSM-associated protein Csm4 (group 5 of RAMP superfamily)